MHGNVRLEINSCRGIAYSDLECSRHGSEAAGESFGNHERACHQTPFAALFRCLTMLLEKPSEVVTRDEMRQRLWGQDTFVDFDHGLNTAVNKIRDALDDSASVPRYVETVAGKGYRFIAPVTLRADAKPVVEDEPADDQSATSGVSGARRAPGRFAGAGADVAAPRAGDVSGVLCGSAGKSCRDP